MTDAQVKAEWAAAYDEMGHVAHLCESCGECRAEYLSGSGFLCERCADSAIAYGRQHMPEAYDEQ